MSTVYDEINQLPIFQVLNRLGIEFNSARCIKEGGIVTSGRKVNTHGNYVNDFSKDRACGNPYNFVKQYLNLSNKETYERFEENFGITDDDRKQNYNTQRSSNKSFISYRPY